MERRASSMKARIRSIITGQNVRDFLTRNLFVLLTIDAIVAGVILGFALRPLNLTERQIKYFSFPGELLMRMLQMVMIPLVVSSLVTGIASLDSKVSGRMARRAAAYYAVTTLLAVLLGIAMVVIIRPGKVGGGGGDSPGDSEVSGGGTVEPIRAADAMLDLIRNMIPSNLVEACFMSHRTTYRKVNVTVAHSNNLTVEELVPVAVSSPGVNVLGLVAFSLSLGLVVGNMRERGDALRDFFAGLNEAVMSLVAGVIWYSPAGILFLIAGKIAEMSDLAQLGSQIGMYTLTVTAGLLVHGLLVLPLLFLLATGRSPYGFMGGLLQALLTALGTSSSSATLPVTLRCVEENNGVDVRVARFVLPVGATVNMDGDALYEAVAAIFIAQVYDVDLDFGQTVVVSLTATLASVGAAGIPQGGLVTMAMVLASVGLPMEGVTLILVVDWFVDRVRTAVNVLGDCLCAGVVEHLSRDELQHGDPELGDPVQSGDPEMGENGDTILPVVEGN